MVALAACAGVVTILAFESGRFEVVAGSLHLTVSKGLKPILLTLLVLGLGVAPRAWYAWAGRWLRRVVGSKGFQRACLALVAVLVFFSLFELVLMAVGFEAELPPIVIKGEVDQGDDSSRITIPDPELKWKLNPGVVFNGRPVNSMGFLDREVDPVKRPGSIRVICVGDSCTGQGIPPYSGFLHQRLVEAPPSGVPWEAFNMGVHGYSSIQGLRLFQLRGKNLAPDVVTVFYGWNDHWRGGRTDSSSMGLRGNRFTAFAYEFLRERRFFQFMIHTLNPQRSLVRISSEVGLRVPPDEYVWALTTFVKEVRSVGAIPVLLTAPRGSRLTSLLIRNHQALDIDVVTRLHDEYVELTRQVAEDTGARLVDLAAEFSNPESAALFSDDGIHFQREGRIRIADRLYQEMVALAPELAAKR